MRRSGDISSLSNTKSGGATVADAANSTLNLADTIKGGTGTDTLQLTLAGAGNAAGDAGVIPSGISITDVEVVKLVHTTNDWTLNSLGTSATYVSHPE